MPEDKTAYVLEYPDMLCCITVPKADQPSPGPIINEIVNARHKLEETNMSFLRVDGKRGLDITIAKYPSDWDRIIYPLISTMRLRISAGVLTPTPHDITCIMQHCNLQQIDVIGRVSAYYTETNEALLLVHNVVTDTRMGVYVPINIKLELLLRIVTWIVRYTTRPNNVDNTPITLPFHPTTVFHVNADFKPGGYLLSEVAILANGRIPDMATLQQALYRCATPDRVNFEYAAKSFFFLANMVAGVDCTNEFLTHGTWRTGHVRGLNAKGVWAQIDSISIGDTVFLRNAMLSRKDKSIIIAVGYVRAIRGDGQFDIDWLQFPEPRVIPAIGCVAACNRRIWNRATKSNIKAAIAKLLLG